MASHLPGSGTSAGGAGEESNSKKKKKKKRPKGEGILYHLHPSEKEGRKDTT